MTFFNSFLLDKDNFFSISLPVYFSFILCYFMSCCTLIGHQEEYPAEPPPAYSSGDHTPEEHPLIDEDDELLPSSPAQQRQRGIFLSDRIV